MVPSQMWKLLIQSDLLAWKMWSQPCGWSLFFLAQTIVTFLQFYWSEPQNSLSFKYHPSWMSPKTSPESIWILFMCFEVFFFYICTGWVWSLICGCSKKLFPEVLLIPFIDLNYRIESVFNEVLPEGPDSQALVQYGLFICILRLFWIL